jgi:hypothetical protein
MNIIFASILLFIAGVVCKLYDDLNDNDLFYGTFWVKNKEYVNEFLKGVHYILLTYVSTIYIYPIFFFVMPCICLYNLDPKAVENPYEWSGILILFLFSILLCINNFEKIKNYKFISCLILFVLGAYLDIIPLKNIEYGYTKLILRGICVINLILLLIANYYFSFLEDEIMITAWYSVGYALTCIIFQYLLCFKYISSPHSVTPADVIDNESTTKPIQVDNLIIKEEENNNKIELVNS